MNTVFSTQYTVFRKSIANTDAYWHLMGALKYTSFLFLFLGIEHWILNTAQAESLGVHGVIYPIEEVDPIQVIQKKLKSMEENGELKGRNLELQKKARASVERPKPAPGITKATKNHVFYYDPTYTVKEDLYDHQGRILAKKGSKINPLETVSLSTSLIFFDGDDNEQLIWVKEKLAAQRSSKDTHSKSIKLILVKGTPLKLSEELGVSVYFDQWGILTKKLGIKHVPALITQDGQKLKIEEIKLPPSGESKTEEGL